METAIPAFKASLRDQAYPCRCRRLPEGYRLSSARTAGRRLRRRSIWGSPDGESDRASSAARIEPDRENDYFPAMSVRRKIRSHSAAGRLARHPAQENAGRGGELGGGAWPDKGGMFPL